MVLPLQCQPSRRIYPDYFPAIGHSPIRDLPGKSTETMTETKNLALGGNQRKAVCHAVVAMTNAAVGVRESGLEVWHVFSPNLLTAMLPDAWSVATQYGFGIPGDGRLHRPVLKNGGTIQKAFGQPFTITVPQTLFLIKIQVKMNVKYVDQYFCTARIKRV